MLIKEEHYPEWRWANFTKEEVMCKCGCGSLPAPWAMDGLQQLRRKFNKPMPITSAARCPEYNQKVSKKTGLSGPHTTGTAFDIAVSREDAWRLIQLATRDSWNGLGVNQKGKSRFIHIDKRKDPAVWSY